METVLQKNRDFSLTMVHSFMYNDYSGKYEAQHTGPVWWCCRLWHIPLTGGLMEGDCPKIFQPESHI